MAKDTQDKSAPDPAEVTEQAQKDAQKQRDQEVARAAAREERNADDPAVEDEFPVERLIDEGDDLLGHPAHVVAGALDAANNRKKNLTRDEARAAVDEFLAREV